MTSVLLNLYIIPIVYYMIEVPSGEPVLSEAENNSENQDITEIM